MGAATQLGMTLLMLTELLLLTSGQYLDLAGVGDVSFVSLSGDEPLIALTAIIIQNFRR